MSKASDLLFTFLHNPLSSRLLFDRESLRNSLREPLKRLGHELSPSPAFFFEACPPKMVLFAPFVGLAAVYAGLVFAAPKNKDSDMDMELCV